MSGLYTGWIWRDKRGAEEDNRAGIEGAAAAAAATAVAAARGANQRIEQNNEIESLVVAARTFHA